MTFLICMKSTFCHYLTRALFSKKQFSMFSKNNVCEINLFQPFIYRTLKKKLPMRTWKDRIIFNHNYPQKNWNHVSQEKKLPITLCLKSIGILFFCIILCNFKKTLLPNVSIEAVRTLIYCYTQKTGCWRKSKFSFFIPQICGMVSDLPVSIN